MGDIFCLVIEVFNPFTFNVIIDVVGFMSVILLIVFYMSYVFLVPQFFHYCHYFLVYHLSSFVVTVYYIFE